MEPIPTKMRGLILADCQSGMTNVAVVAKWKVSPSFVVKLKRRFRETGSFEPKKGKTGPKPKLAPHYSALRRLIKKRPDATLFEIRDALPIKVSHQTVAVTLRRLKLTHKKTVESFRARQTRCCPQASRMESQAAGFET